VPGAATLELDVDAVGVDGPVSGMRVSAAGSASNPAVVGLWNNEMTMLNA